MASTTPNIGLTLPTGAEKVSRQVINDNNTIIDGKMGAVPGGQNLQGEIDALNSNKFDKASTHYLGASSSVSITLKPRGTYLVGVNSNNGTGLYTIVNYNYGGTVTTIVNTSSVSLSMSGVVLTVTNNVAYSFGVMVLPLWEEINNT